jgi:uncharacterized membrane protein YfcA
VGTDLLFAATTKLVATASFGFSRRVDWPIVGRLLLGSIPGSAAVVIGLWLARRTPGAADAFTQHALAIILLVTALALIFQTQLQRVGLKITARALVHVERHKLLLTALAGLTLGVAVTLTSVGAGALGVVIAGLGHAFLGHVNFNVLAALLLGSIPGVLIASRISIRLPARITRILIAIMLGTVSERLLFA